MLVWLKLNHIKFLKVGLTHPDTAIGSRITPACVHLNQTRTGLSNLHMINSPRKFFDQELKQHKFGQESREENKNPESKRGEVCILFVPHVKCRYKVYSTVQLSMFHCSSLANLFLACLANWKKVL